MRAWVTFGVIGTLLSAAPTAFQDVEWHQEDVPGWFVFRSSDVFTDEWKGGIATHDGVWVTCDPSREHFASGLEVRLLGLPPVGDERAEITYRIGRETAATGAWKATTGSGGSSLVVPDELAETVLRAGRIAVRVHGETRVIEWENGAAIYRLINECGGG